MSTIMVEKQVNLIAHTFGSKVVWEHIVFDVVFISDRNQPTRKTKLTFT